MEGEKVRGEMMRVKGQWDSSTLLVLSKDLTR